MVYTPVLLGILAVLAGVQGASHDRRIRRGDDVAKVDGRVPSFRGEPSCMDLEQSICGVVNSDPTWISSAFEGGYGNASPDEVTVKLFRGTKRGGGGGAELEMEEEEHIVTYAEVSENKDGDGQSDTYLGKAWWPIAIERALRKLEYDFTEDDRVGLTEAGWKYGWSDGAYRALTGLETETHSWKLLEIEDEAGKQDLRDRFWQEMQKANYSPVVIGARRTKYLPVADHVYTILEAWEEDGERKIEVFNPWGSILTYNSDEVAEDVEETFVLKDDTSLGRGIDGDEDSPE